MSQYCFEEDKHKIIGTLQYNTSVHIELAISYLLALREHDHAKLLTYCLTT